MAGDAKFNKRALLLHMDGSDGSTVFTDKSIRTKSVSVVGAVSISTDHSQFGGASGYFNGGLLSVANHPDLAPAGDFCIECRIRPTDMSRNAIVLNKMAGTSAGYPYQVVLTAAGALLFRSYDASSTELFTAATSSGLIAINTWSAVAFLRRGNTFEVRVDGIERASATYSGALPINSEPMQIGAYSTGAFNFFGFLDEFRFTTGDSEYTGDYTPSTGPFSDYAGRISGIVKDDAGSTASRIVRAYRRDTGAMIGSSVSDPSTGAYTIDCAEAIECSVICLDDSAGATYNDLIARAMPV